MSPPALVHGRHIPAPRLTALGAALVAATLAVPGGLAIGCLAWLIG